MRSEKESVAIDQRLMDKKSGGIRDVLLILLGSGIPARLYL